MRMLAAILLATVASVGVALYLLSVALPDVLRTDGDPLIGRWEASEEELDWEFLSDGIIVMSEGPDSLRGKWRRLDDDQILLEFDTRGTYEAIVAQVNMLEGGNEAFVTVDGQRVRLERLAEE